MKNLYISLIRQHSLNSVKNYERYGVAESQCLLQMHFALKQLDRLEKEMRCSPDWKIRDAIKHQVLARCPYECLRLTASQLDQSCEASGREYAWLIEKALKTCALLNAVCKGDLSWDWFNNEWKST